MTSRRLKVGYFALEGLNAFAVAYYVFYLFFHMQRAFGFGDLGNLGLSAFHGLIYMVGAANAGRFAQRRGYFFAARLGLTIMAVALALGSVFPSVVGQVATLGLWTFGMSFTWPVFEALVSEGESPSGLQRMIGIYNLVWAGCGAVSYFMGGALLENLGSHSLYVLPGVIHLVQIGLITWLEGRANQLPPASQPSPESRAADALIPTRHPGRTKSFLTMAWIANPFAFVAINTVMAVIPTLAQRFGLTPTWAGVFCSVWLFARLGAFLLLWLWPGWHYRFRWFITAYLLMVASFLLILLAPRLWLVVVAQVAFGYATGLLYYASLYYSMDVGETKGEHGGIHEAAIGAGVFAGPAVGASTLYFLPQFPSGGTIAVSVLLVSGFVALLVTRRRHRPI